MPSPPSARLSLEVFPGKTPKGASALMASLEALRRLDPEFVSVTCGAGGSRRTTNCDTVERIHRDLGLPVAAHMTCVAASQDDVDWLAERYRSLGIDRIVALRGDRPKDGPPANGTADVFDGPFRHASDLVAWLAGFGGFEIAVAAYPETHPEAASAEADLDALKLKLACGATSAITQFFFDAEIFLRFRDRVRAAGIEAPLIPGILPIQSFRRTREMAVSCGASIPPGVVAAFDAAGDDPDRQAAASLEVSATLCSALMREGVDHFHLYTLNKAEPTLALAERLGWADRGSPSPARSRAPAGCDGATPPGAPPAPGRLHAAAY